MQFLKKIRQPLFWINTLKISVPFLVIVVVISILMNNWSDVFAGNFEAVNNTLFSDGKWMQFWTSKIIISLFYGLWITNKKMP